MSEAHPPPRVLVRCRLLLVSACTLLLFLGGVHHFVYFEGGDSADYFLLARSLVQGHGYSTLYAPPPAPHTKYPFFFPLLLGGNLLLPPRGSTPRSAPSTTSRPASSCSARPCPSP